MYDVNWLTAPPGSPPTYKFKGPWFSTQLILSLSIGISSFLLFCLLRTRWEVIYMGRTKLKDFSPGPAHSDATQSSPSSRFLGWVLPTLRTSEFTILQTVGLDAAVLLNFFRMSFYLFSISAFAAAVVLMPVNWTRNGSVDADPDFPDNSTHGDISTSSGYQSSITQDGRNQNRTPSSPPTFYDLIIDPETSATLNLVFTYVFTLLCLSFFHRNFHRFVQARQSFSLHLIHSVSARTVLVTNVPAHLRGDKALADYFEGMSWPVESVSVCRDVTKLKELLDERTNALLKLEAAWTTFVGNPANKTKGYDPDIYSGPTRSSPLTASPQQAHEPLIPGLDAPSNDTTNGDIEQSQPASDLESNVLSPSHDVQGERPRPRYRPKWFGASVDAIAHWEERFRNADDNVRAMRKTGQFGATHAAFVTFEDVKDAQSACQVVHFPHHSQVVTTLAPEPRDVLWSNVALSKRSSTLRRTIVLILVAVVLLFWIAPITFLASFLSFQEIKRVAPWLARIIAANPRIGAIVQNTLPSSALILFNGLLPFLLEWLSMEQGLVSRSAVEYALMRKYTLALLLNVLGVFLVASSYWTLAKELANAPMKIPEKLAEVLQGSTARNFFMSYVMLQGIGIMPFQLLNIGSVLTLGFYRLFYTRTPRDFAEIYAPPSLNYGTVYPQAILVFTICLCYSVVSPLILVFGSIYFGVGYLVYKYKVLFVFYKPYESSGSAWRITFSRLLWGVFIFQLFMTGLFTLRGRWVLSLALIPLLLYTAYWSWTIYADFRPLCKYVALSNICEVERGEAAERVVGVRGEETVTRSQSNLNRQRYGLNDETLYVAPSDSRTDYSQPPMSSFYSGVLNTGRRKYAHPALSGRLPTPWLPSKAQHPSVRLKGPKSVVLSLRRKVGKKLSKGHRSQPVDAAEDDDWGTPVPHPRATSADDVGPPTQLSTSSNPWNEQSLSSLSGQDKSLRQQSSFDQASGVIALPEDNVWAASGDTSDEEDAATATAQGSVDSTYYPHPERRRSTSGTRDAGWTD